MGTPFRIIDTGTRGGRLQIAFDQALVELHKAGSVPDTIRFLRFSPSALVGRHQAVSQEIRVEHCRAQGVEVVRRITGGGAIYLDPGQVGWELVLSRARLPMPSLADYTRAICESAADGLSRAFGIAAQFRPRNDIEVEGRKLCGTGGFFDGDTLCYQGTVLVDVDPSAMMACLNVPAGKLQKRELDRAEGRVTTLKTLLGKAPTIEAVHEAVLDGLVRGLGLKIERDRTREATAAEWQLAQQIFGNEIGSDDFVYSIDDPAGEEVLTATRTGPGGSVSAYVRLEGQGGARRIREILFTGDFFVTPPRLVLDLEAALRGVGVSDATVAVETFFSVRQPDMLSLKPEDFRDVLAAAISAQT